MRIEVLPTGDELLTGLTPDTNSTYFSARVFELGQKLERITVVGDVRADITRGLLEAASRADVVLVSGGLGPTADDFTAECAAAAAGVGVVEDPGVLAHLQQRFAQRKLTLTPNNVRQARVPQGAEVVINPVGSAPMFILRIQQCTLFFLPGVPREYRYLVDHEVVPRIRAMLEHERGRIYRAFRLIKTTGLPESHLDALVAPVAKRYPQVVFGFRTHAPENHLKLMAEASSQADAEAALAGAEAESMEAIRPYVFGTGDEELPAVVGAQLERRKETVAVAESCTGGLLGELFTRRAGSSAYFLGGMLTYANALKVNLLGVREETLAVHGAVSEPSAREMAEGARQRTGATYALSITGIAGPGGGSAEKPVGTVFVALAAPDGTTVAKHQFIGERDRVRAFSAYAALEMLRRHLNALEGRP